jgi:hypothetical protein
LQGVEALLLPDPALTPGRGLSQQLGQQALGAPSLPSQPCELLGRTQYGTLEDLIVFRGQLLIEQREAHPRRGLVGPIPAVETDRQVPFDLDRLDTGQLTHDESRQDFRIGVLFSHRWKSSRMSAFFILYDLCDQHPS